MIAQPFPAQQIDKGLNADHNLPFKSVEIKICPSVNVKKLDTKLVNFAVHVESVAGKYVCFSNHILFKFDK